jgi:hypothetical protein
MTRRRWLLLGAVFLLMATAAVGFMAIWLTMPRQLTYKELIGRAFTMTPEQFEAVGGKASGTKKNEWTWMDENAAVVVIFDESRKVNEVECYVFTDNSILARLRRWIGL